VDHEAAHLAGQEIVEPLGICTRQGREVEDESQKTAKHRFILLKKATGT
jgi:hypothetical protein